MTDLNQALVNLRIALVILGGPPQAQRRHVQLGTIRRASETVMQFDDDREGLIHAELIDDETAALVTELAAEIRLRLSANADFFRESVAAPREFLFGDELETDEWSSVRLAARRAFTAVAGETSRFTALIAK
jgi:hypothetical protein